jgi:hypothetical protein
MFDITYPQSEINRFNAEYEAEKQTASRVKSARLICRIYTEKSEIGKREDGQKFMGLIKGVLR